jgi:hypothetical protein
MRNLRLITAATMTLGLLLAASVSIVHGQEEAESMPPPPPAPPPGEFFAGILIGSVSFEPLEAPTEACPLGVKTITTASGSTTLGAVTLYAEHCPTLGLPSVPVGQQTLTTETGDELSGMYFVDCDPLLPSAATGEPITCLGRVQFSGGTGSFAEASGSANWVVHLWFPGSMEALEWPWVSKLEGAISY